MMGYGYGMSWFGMIIPLLLIGVIIYAAVRLTQDNSRSNSRKNDEGNALNILSERFARGEISEEEYIQKKQLLRK